MSGRCTHHNCPEPPVPGYRRCQRHREMNRLASAKYHANLTPEQMEARRAKQREQGRGRWGRLSPERKAALLARQKIQRANRKLTAEQLARKAERERERRRRQLEARGGQHRSSTLAERQKPCSECGEVFDTGARMGTKRYEQRKVCGLPKCVAEANLRRSRKGMAVRWGHLGKPQREARQAAFVEQAAEVAARSAIIGHENGVPIRRVDRGVGYDE